MHSWRPRTSRPRRLEARARVLEPDPHSSDELIAAVRIACGRDQEAGRRGQPRRPVLPRRSVGFLEPARSAATLCDMGGRTTSSAAARDEPDGTGGQPRNLHSALRSAAFGGGTRFARAPAVDALMEPLPSPHPAPIPHPASSGEADAQLVSEVLSGRQERLGELARRFCCLPRIVRALDARLGSRLQEHDLLDVAQDALVLAWQKLADYGGEARLESWLYGIARLELLNALRRRARRHARGADVTEIDPAGPGSAPGLSLDYEVLQRALATLDPAEASVVRLKHFEELTFDEIGARLGTSPNTAKTRYYRGLARLEERLRATLGRDLEP